MDSYNEDYNYCNCFWMKSDILYSHAELKFEQYQSIGLVFKAFSNGLKKIYEFLPKFNAFYKSVDSESTLSKGIEVLFKIINQISDPLKNLYNDIIIFSRNIEDKNISFQSKKVFLNMCVEVFKKYEDNINKLEKQKKLYYDSVNKII